MVLLIHVFNLEEEKHGVAGYVMTCLFCMYGVVCAASWMYVVCSGNLARLG